MATETGTIKATIFDLGYSRTLTKDDDFYNENAQVVSKITSGIASANVLGGDSVGNQTMTDGMYRSSNYVYGVSGWSLEPDNAYFWNVTISGTLISANIHIPDENTTANSFHVESDGDTWWGCTHTNFTANNENAAAYVLKNGTVKFNSGVISGWTLGSTFLSAVSGGNTTIVSSGATAFSAGPTGAPTFTVTQAGAIGATSGNIAGWNLSSTAIYFNGATDVLSSGMAPADFPFYAGKKYVDRATAPYRVTPAGELFASSATITGAITAAAGSVIATSYLSGAVGLSNTNIAAMGWTSTLVFSTTDYRKISWSAGVITTAAGTSYNIDAGDTGNMTAGTFYYIYLDIAVSTTVLQKTTTATTANGSGKIHIATAYPNSDTTSKATVQGFGGKGAQIIMVDNIVANSASTNVLVTNSAQIADAMITNAKVVSLDVAKLTAGSITSKAITLAVSEGTGDSYIAAGKTDFTNTESGFILGIDDSDGNKAKFYIGTSTKYLNWTGTSFDLYGITLTAGTIQTAATGERIVMDSSGLYAYDSSNVTHFQLSTTGIFQAYQYFSSGFVGVMDYIPTDTDAAGSVLILQISPNITDGGAYTISGPSGLWIIADNTIVSSSLTKTGTGTITLSGFNGQNFGNAIKQYKIEIDGTGTPNTFKWSDDNGVGWVATTVAITGSSQTLTSADGSYINITFSATTGGVLGDYWTGTAGANDVSNHSLANLDQEKTYNSAAVINIINKSTHSLGYDIDGNDSNWYCKPDGTVYGQEIQADGDIGGLAGANTLTGVSNVAANSTGVGTIKFKGTGSRDSSGFIKIYIGTTAYYVPVFNDITT